MSELPEQDGLSDLTLSIFSWRGIYLWFHDSDLVKQIVFQVQLKRLRQTLLNARFETKESIDKIKKRRAEVYKVRLERRIPITKEELDEQIASDKKVDDKFHETKLTLMERLNEADLNVYRAITGFLSSEVDRLLLPPPDPNNKEIWRQNGVLSTIGITNLRSTIRKEQKERLDVLQSRLALTLGVVATVLALLATTISLWRR